MMDESHVWLTVENEEDKEFLQKLKYKIGDSVYKTMEIPYYVFKKYMVFDYLQIGKIDDDYDIISGILEINGLTYKLQGFKPEITLDMAFFRPFFKRLTKDIKLKYRAIIKIYYGNDLPHHLPVWVEVEGRIGAIAPRVDEE